jgi:radical SAM superfamily enzyme YgiQ (UPF0313 family)
MIAESKTPARRLRCVALACMTPEVDAGEHSRELPSYGIHRIQAAVLADPTLDGVEVPVIDQHQPDVAAYVDAIVSREPEVVGLSLFVWSAPCLVEVAREIRRQLPETVIVCGGPSARIALLDRPPYGPAAEYADALVTTAGEDAFAALVRLVAAGVRRADLSAALRGVGGLEIPTATGWHATDRPLGERSLDRLPSPYQMGLMRYGAVGYLETFRGCPVSCRFCEWGVMDAAAGVFSREYLVRELEGLAAHAAKSVFHVDSGLNLNAAAFRNLAAAEREVGFLKQTGLWCEIYPARITDEHLEFLAACGPSYLGVGLQSMQREVLKNLERPYGRENFETAIARLKSAVAGMEVQVIFGLPTDSPAGFLETLAYARSLGVGVRVYHCLVLPDALLTRSEPEWNVKFSPLTLAMESCIGWTAESLLDMRAYLTEEVTRCGGTAGKFWWSFPSGGRRPPAGVA